MIQTGTVGGVAQYGVSNRDLNGCISYCENLSGCAGFTRGVNYTDIDATGVCSFYTSTGIATRVANNYNNTFVK